MKFDKKYLTLYAVTDRSWLHGETLYSQVEKAIQGGVTFVQLREKKLDEVFFIQEAKEIKALCKQYNVPFVINDNVQVALAIDADGVHVGQHDMETGALRKKLGPSKIIGVSVHTVEQAILAEQRGANYIGVGAVFPTASKDDAEHVNYDLLKAICSAVHIPVIAIGGINKDNIGQLSGSGICGIAAIREFFSKKDITAATKELNQSIQDVVDQNPRRQNIKTALTIAGSDSCGGAGIQADIKTMTANGVYAMSAITALTAQNTTGVTGIMEVTKDFLAEQLDDIMTDIYPDAVKIGMVSSTALIKTIAKKLRQYHIRVIVIDPVMVATSGDRLITEDAIDALEQDLFPMATIITPNIPEAEVLSGLTIQTTENMIEAANLLYDKYGCAVLLKGGHHLNNANDLLYSSKGGQWFYGERVDNSNTHGTGCTLSSAITSNLAKGYDLDLSVKKAKNYISGALAAMLDLGKGSGPINHAFAIQGEY